VLKNSKRGRNNALKDLILELCVWVVEANETVDLTIKHFFVCERGE
jgi:hypothetical protein